eukprot:9382936-Alexandrium_andersonii.AAC.1
MLLTPLARELLICGSSTPLAAWALRSLHRDDRASFGGLGMGRPRRSRRDDGRRQRSRSGRRRRSPTRDNRPPRPSSRPPQVGGVSSSGGRCPR